MLAVVGAGRWGRNHIRNFAALGVLSAICDSSREALEAAGGAFPGVAVYTDLVEVLSDHAIEAVVLATPAELHFAQAQAALASGRHVLVEKPMTLSLGEAEALDGAARRRGLVLMVGHLLEYHPAFVRLRELVSAGELGEVIRMDSHRLSPGVFGRSESVLWDLGPHDVSMVLRLAGDIPSSVRATGSCHVRAGVEDVVTVDLTFGSGARAQILLSYLHPLKEQRIIVVGTRTTAVFDDVAQEGKLRLYPTRAPFGSNQAAQAAAEPQVVCYPRGEPLRLECEHFLHCIRTGERPLTDGASGVRVARVLDGCERSLRSEGGRVELGADPTASR